MSWLRRLERRLQPLAIPNLTQVLIAGQVVVFLLMFLKPEAAEMLQMYPEQVLAGQVWRLLTFLFIPSIGNPHDVITVIFFLFFLMFLNLMGNALESSWGTLRYNLFVLIGYLSSIGSTMLLHALVGGNPAAMNVFVYETIFLAFAWSFPDFEIVVMFILPVKVKWLALLTVVLTAFAFVSGLLTFFQGGWVTCALIAAASINLAIFLGRDVADRLRSTNRRMLRKFEGLSTVKTARHSCFICGATELTHPDREFRYCTQCTGTPGYCNLHLAGHQHRTAESQPNNV